MKSGTKPKSIAKKPKSRKPFAQPKFPIYQSLYNLNTAFQSIAQEIEVLDDYEAIPLDTLRLYRMTAEELRAAMNHCITDVLITREEKDWNHYGKLRIAEIERLKQRRT
jgi:hypothetical protein